MVTEKRMKPAATEALAPASPDQLKELQSWFEL